MGAPLLCRGETDGLERGFEPARAFAQMGAMSVPRDLVIHRGCWVVRASTTNHRNGSTSRTVMTGDGKVQIATPRDRDGRFEPLLVPRHARRFTGFDDKIVVSSPLGLTVPKIQ